MAMFTDLRPGCGDTTAVLWRKINEALSNQNGGVHPPKQADWKYQSLWKVAAILANCE